MSWNADNTAWNPISPGAAANSYHKLSHQGNGKWRMVSAAVGDMVESDGGSEDFDDGYMFVLWETGEFYKAKSNDNYPTTAWYQARWNGSAWVQGTYGGGLSQHYPYLEYTFSGNGPGRIYVGYAGYGTGFAGNSTGANAYTESNIVSNSVAGTPFPFSGPFPGSFSDSFYIDIAEVNPDNPATIQAGDMVGVVVSRDHQDRNSDEDSDCYTYASFFKDFDTLSIGSKGSGGVPYLSTPTVYWNYSAQTVWHGVGEVGDCIGNNDANLEHTATMAGATYKIRFRQILNASVPSGISLNLSNANVNLVTSSTWDTYHSFLPGTHMQAFYKVVGDSDNYNYIEAYVHEVVDAPANDNGGSSGGSSAAAASRTFKGSGSVSFTEIKDFLNPEGNIGTTNISLIGMFGSAQTIPATMPNGNFVAPHNVSEFYNASISTGPYISVTSITDSTQAAYLAWLASSASTGAAAQPADTSGPTCHRVTMVNTGVGFTSIAGIQALFPAHVSFTDGVDASYSTQLTFGGGSSGLALGTAGTLDSDGKITKWCSSNYNFDVDEDDDGPNAHTVFILQDPLELWVRVPSGAPGANGFRWNKGWTINGWGTWNSPNPNGAPDFTNRIYAKWTQTPYFSYQSD